MIYEFGGILHEIAPEEVTMIKRSGPLHRVQDYADIHHGRKYAVEYCGTNSIRAAIAQVEPDPFEPIAILPTRCKKIHLAGYKCAGSGGLAAYNDDAFATLMATNPGKALSLIHI